MPRACLKKHSCNLHAPLCGIFCPNSVAVARYGALIRTKSPTNCDAHLAESLFQTRSSGHAPFFYANKFQIRIIHASIEIIAEMCRVPMILNGNRIINMGSMVKIAAQRGRAAVPVRMAMIKVMINTM